MDEGESYLKQALEQGEGNDPNYRGNLEVDDYLRGRPDWNKQLQWAAPRPDGFAVEAEAGTIYFDMGRMHDADQHWEHAAQRMEAQHLNDSAGSVYGLKALHDGLVGNCSLARETAHRALTVDHSVATVPNAALAMALCGEGSTAIKEIERVAAEQPMNTLVNEIYVPEVKAAVALADRKYDQVAHILDPVAPYILVSKAPQLLGRASLELHNPQQAIADFKAGLRYRGLNMQEGGAGSPQVPDYTLSLLGTARAQVQIDKAAARKSYQQLLTIWKNADPDFGPAQEAKRELAALGN
jgi:tetratricopeptide (TPR) repeat protein